MTARHAKFLLVGTGIGFFVGPFAAIARFAAAGEEVSPAVLIMVAVFMLLGCVCMAVAAEGWGGVE